MKENNSNIFLAANQAAKLYKGAHVEVVKSKSIAQCYSALTMLDFSSDDLVIIMGNFNEVVANVSSGEVTCATRDTKINGIDIKKDQHIGLVDGKLVSADETASDCVISCLKKVNDIDEKQVLVLIYGENVKVEEATELVDRLNEEFPFLEVGALPGGQAIYDYYFSIE